MTTTSFDAASLGARPITRSGRRRPARHPGSANWPLTIVLAVCALTVIVPIYVTVSMAFKTTKQAVNGNAFELPAPFSLSGFEQAWRLTDFPRSFALSVFVAVVAVS